MKNAVKRCCKKYPAILTLTVLAGALVLMYWKVFSFAYYSDDVDNIPTAAKSLSHLLLLPQQPDNPLPSAYYRPVAWLTYWAIQRNGLASPSFEYAVNLFLHLFNAFMLYLLIRSGIAAERDVSAYVPALFSLIFSLGLIPAYSVMWISQRFDLLSTFFVLLTLLLAVRHWIYGSGKHLVLMGVSTILAALSKEIAFSLPFLLGGLYLLMNRFDSQRTGSRPRIISGLAVISISLGLVFLIRQTIIPHSADFAFIPPHTAIPVIIRSIVELLQPFRTITLAYLFTVRTGATYTLMGLSSAMTLLWVCLLWFGYRHKGYLATIAITLPFVGFWIITGSLGWVNPRMLYLPYCVLVLMTALPFVLDKPKRGILAAFMVILILQIGATYAVVSYFDSLHENNSWANGLQRARGQHSYLVITQEYNRQWHQKRGGELFPILFSEADPVYEGLTNLPYDQRFSVVLISHRSARIQSLVPNRFFQLRKGQWTSHSQKGDQFVFKGYTIEVLETMLDGRATSLLVSWTRDELTAHPLYIDNGEGFVPLSSVKRTTAQFH